MYHACGMRVVGQHHDDHERNNSAEGHSNRCTITAALSGGDASDTVDGQQGVDNVDFARIVSLYDALAIWDINAKPVMSLAESIEPNKSADVWTIKLRSGIEFHNGKTLTAADVIYSYRRVQMNDLGGASSIALCDMKNATAPDDLTVVIPCISPFATFVQSIIGYYYYLSIIPDGFSPVTKAHPKITSPIGTGPFKFESFTPNDQSVFTKNRTTGTADCPMWTAWSSWTRRPS